MNIRPVSDLRNKYSEVEAELKESGSVYLTKNGYGTAVLLNIEDYAALTGSGKGMSINRKNTKPAAGGRGFLRKYADPEMIPHEREAAGMHAIRKYGMKKEVGNE